MNISNIIVSADFNRSNVGDKNAFVDITLNLVGGGTWKHPGGFYLNEDTDLMKNGTPAEKKAIRKKYIRQAVAAYLKTQEAPPVVTPATTMNVIADDFKEQGE